MRKKIILPLICLIFFCYFWQVSAKPLFNDYAKTFETYSSDKSSGQIKFVCEKDFSKLFFVYGESVSLIKDVKNSTSFIQSVLKKYNAKVVIKSENSIGTNVYAYSKNIKYIEKVGGKRVNLHIFIYKSGQITLGSPLIYGSF